MVLYIKKRIFQNLNSALKDSFIVYFRKPLFKNPSQLFVLCCFFAVERIWTNVPWSYKYVHQMLITANRKGNCEMALNCVVLKIGQGELSELKREATWN